MYVPEPALARRPGILPGEPVALALTRRCRRGTTCLAAGALVLLLTTPATALTLVFPPGGKPGLLPGNRVVCSSPPAGWSVDAQYTRIRPPAEAPRLGVAGELRVAPLAEGCSAEGAEVARLVLAGPLPRVHRPGVDVLIDEGRVEVRGNGLAGARVHWQGGDQAGSDVCLDVKKDQGFDLCAVAASNQLPADPQRIVVKVAPEGAELGPDTFVFDQNGQELGRDQLEFPPARVIVNRLLVSTETVDLSKGAASVPLKHPGAVAAAQCGSSRCSLSRDHLLVSGVPATDATVTVGLSLVPRVYVAAKGTLADNSTETISIARCALEFTSGRPPRNVDDLKVLMRLDPACAKDADRLTWTLNREPVDVERLETTDRGTWVLLETGRLFSEWVRVLAARPEPDGSVVAVARVRTREIPPIQVTLTLPGLGRVEFIPKNREALLETSAVSSEGALYPLAVRGAYAIARRAGRYYVRGTGAVGGYAALRFAYRSRTLPQIFAETTLGVVSDPVQRPIREAHVPTALGSMRPPGERVVEFLCVTRRGLRSLPPGSAEHIPFASRESCRLVVHHARIPEADGEQRLQIEVSVTSADGGERPEGRQSHHLVIRHGPQEDTLWIRGVKQQFDRISVRITQVVDESSYPGGPSAALNLPAAQWSVVAENASFRFYATAALPTALYRFSDDPQDLGSGPLALNFGVLSRLTWLDSNGREGLVGLEAGTMGMGLATEQERQLAIVGGLGISIPLGNLHQPTQAAVNVHGWGAYTLGTRYGKLEDNQGQVTGRVRLNPWAFVFGPSITIGNVGTFL